MPDSSRLERFASRSLLALTSVILVYLVSRSTLIATAVSPARDGARYFSYARELAERPLREVAPEHEDHPGYPLTVHAAFRVGEVFGFTSLAARVRLAQTATAVSGLLLVVVAYFLARRVWGPVIAWAGLMAFTLLPRPAWQTSDILSDPLYAALFLTASLLFVTGFGTGDDPGKPARNRGFLFFASGICCSLAYWVRVDAAILILAALGTLAFLAFESRPRAGRSTTPTLPLSLILRGAVSFASGFAVGLFAFINVYGRLSDKPILDFLIGDDRITGDADLLLASAHAGLMETGGKLLGSIGAVLSSGCQETQYVHVILAGLGAVLAYRQGARHPAGKFVSAVFLVSVLAFSAVRHQAGYVSARYFLPVSPLLACMSFYFLLTGGRMLRDQARIKSAILTQPAILVAFGLCLSLAVSLPSLFGRRLHDDHHGAISAAHWVAGQLKEGDTMYEPNFFPAYFAGLEDRKTPGMFPTESATENHYLILRSREVEKNLALKKLIERWKAVTVKSFPRKPGGEKREVNVYLFRGRRP